MIIKVDVLDFADFAVSRSDRQIDKFSQAMEHDRSP
jgi:hypothetical protein